MVRAVAIILAAGMSSRMGQCKATLPWRTDLTLLAYQIQEFRTVDVVPIVVLGAHNAHLRQAANIPSTACVTINPTPSQGKVSSIFQGLRCLPEQWDVVFISAVDQPRSAKVYRQLLNAYERHGTRITLPSYQQRAGHPPLLSRSLLPQLTGMSDETNGLRHVMKMHRDSTHYVTMDTAEVLLDLNTPGQYNQAINTIRPSRALD